MSTQEELAQTPEGGALQTAKDLFAGAVGGVAQVLVGKHSFSLFLPLANHSSD